MKITKEWLKEKNACQSGIKWFLKQDKTDSIEVLKELVKQDELEDAGWLIVRVMSYKQYVPYAVFAAEQVIDIFEDKYPCDKRPREAIEAAKACINNPSDENKEIAKKAYVVSAAYHEGYYDAYYDAYSAAYSAYSASATAAYTSYPAAYAYSAYSYAYSAYAASATAAYAYPAAYAYAASATYSAAYTSYSASATAARKEMRLKILNYGLELLNGITGQG